MVRSPYEGALAGAIAMVGSDVNLNPGDKKLEALLALLQTIQTSRPNAETLNMLTSIMAEDKKP
jgi:hypothetical protein